MGFPQTTFLLAGALSLGLVITPPSCIALELSTGISSSAQLVQSSTEVCKEEESEKRDGVLIAPELRSDEGVVEQAWEIVNESFLDPSGKRWSPQSWLVKFCFFSFYIVVYIVCV